MPGADEPRLINVTSRAHGLAVDLPRELARSRRHGHQFSLILLRAVRPQPPETARGLRRAIDVVALRLRLSDLLIRLDEHRLLIACPETDAAGVQVLLRDLVGLVAAEGIDVRAGSATFPTTALTASELLRACEASETGDATAAVDDGPSEQMGDVLPSSMRGGGAW